MMSATPESPTEPRPPFLLRGGAHGLDVLIAGAIGALINAFLLGDAGKRVVLEAGVFTLSVKQALGPLWPTLLFTASIGACGQSPGKMAAGLRVVRADGGTIGYGRALLRAVGLLASFATLWLGFVVALIDERGRALHDYIAGTRVVSQTDVGVLRRRSLSVLGTLVAACVPVWLALMTFMLLRMAVMEQKIRQGPLGQWERPLIAELAVRFSGFELFRQRWATRFDGMGQTVMRAGDLVKAEGYFKRSVKIRERGLGPDDPLVATSLNNLGQLSMQQGRAAEAEQLLKKAAAVWTKALGPAHPDLAYALHNLGTLYIGQGRLPEAEPLLLRALALRQGPSVDKTLLIQSHRLLGNLYSARQDDRKASLYHCRAAELGRNAPGAESAANDAAVCVAVLRKLGLDEEAAQYETRLKKPAAVPPQPAP